MKQQTTQLLVILCVLVLFSDEIKYVIQTLLIMLYNRS